MISVVVPVHDVAAYLPACLDSILAQSHRALEVVVVDDGSTDGSGAVADAYAEQDARVRVVHQANQGLGAARNAGLAHATGPLLAFADSDDVVPPDAYATMLEALRRDDSDLVTGSVARWEDGRLTEPPWMRRLHRERRALGIAELPELMGDVFAWNKLWSRAFWDTAGLTWPEGVRYEDQPTLTRAYLAARRISVLPEVVYHWRIRTDGSSITQQRSSLADLTDRWSTKRDSLRSVEQWAADAPAATGGEVVDVMRDRVLAGDLHRYFTEIPGCDDAWWELLRSGVLSLWGAGAPGGRGPSSLTASGLPPVHRLTGWLVEQGRRADAAAVMAWMAEHPGPAPRTSGPDGARLALPVLDPASLDPSAVALRAHEV
ncbi:glycosyltransferase family 2 protein [Nocardioides sp. Leaf374]|uniref:glycosyltransferase family 2 protein n=1 Tax=Nocardioides sp. Leaf374 TaxID=2876560 RepID=UPI001E3E9F28|nr:glycosyltransferase [Nocardioides sp. Leaf374]